MHASRLLSQTNLPTHTWSQLWRTPRARLAIAFCIVSILIIVFYLPSFYGEVIQPKKGIYLNDVVLNAFTPYNWSVLIFTLIYVSVIQTIFSVARNPGLILLGLTTYFMVSLIRMVTMYLYTLEPPLDMIFLVDPLSTKFYPSGTFAKDMFFSGHISTMMVLVLIEKKKWARTVKIGFTLAISVMLAWQHVHYTIDLLVAPIVTYIIFYLLKKYFDPSLTL
ncbi:MAG TPA: phosphatase PAP2-related protein [Saprospiraceae bacterium]|nr:phosphatase PAP2-related protein [Saprospiraceae bacterium]